MFKALDSVWEKSKDEDLGDFLSDANPFLLDSGTSADPAIEKEFSDFISAKGSSVLFDDEDSFKLVSLFLHENESINEMYPSVADLFATVTNEDWKRIITDNK